MSMMKTCPLCSAKAVKAALTCYECFYRFSDQSIRNVNLAALRPSVPASTASQRENTFAS